MQRALARGPVPRSAACVVLLVALATAGCGSDDDRQAVAALKSQILANNAMTGSSEITSQEASCIAGGAVDRLTVERLQDYEILDSDLDVDKKLNDVPLSAKDADRLAGVFVECSDVERIFEDRLVGQLTEGRRPKAARRVESCVRDAVTADSVRDVLAQSFQKTDATAYASLSDRLRRCR